MSFPKKISLTLRYIHAAKNVRHLNSAARDDRISAARVHHDSHFDTPLEMYEARIKSGELTRDDHQLLIIERLQKLNKDLQTYTPKPVPQPGFLSKLLAKKVDARELDAAKKFSNAPNGLYLYGSVGCGKTMIMDMFFDTCHIEKKQRIHFHQFMLDVHQRIHEYKKSIPRQYNVRKTEPYDPIPPVARDISAETWLLCFDEFQVTDIADAMILKRLFGELWRDGVVIISTSNRHPDDLYKNGLQRINFLPFIPMAKVNNDIICLDSGVDYRRKYLPSAKVYFVHGETDSKYEMDRSYEDLVSKEKAEEGMRTLNVLNREVVFQRTCGTILDATFNELCKRPLGAVDYLELCKHFDKVLIRDIPRMTLENRTEARRFITLIDTMYDHRMQVICSAEAGIDELFGFGGPSEYDKHHARVMAGDLDIAVGSENSKASLFTGEEELFAFERVKSRLTEMQTEEYWQMRDLVREQRQKKGKKTKKQTKSS